MFYHFQTPPSHPTPPQKKNQPKKQKQNKTNEKQNKKANSISNQSWLNGSITYFEWGTLTMTYDTWKSWHKLCNATCCSKVVQSRL